MSGCADRLDDAEEIADAASLHRHEIPTRIFTIESFARFEDTTAPIEVYIEGDGAAFSAFGMPSLDPTPRKALGLRLAALDPAPNVVYLARPCQFVTGDPACNASYWTTRRYSEEVVVSMGEAIDALLITHPGPIDLIGYSGGAAIAALLAERRGDVLSLRTIAGNLDPQGLVKEKNATPLDGSLDPMREASKLNHLRQKFLIGQMDEVIPLADTERFIEAEGPQNCVALVTINNVSHEDGWERVWPEYIAKRLGKDEMFKVNN